jgi:hypothetical protein
MTSSNLHITKHSCRNHSLRSLSAKRGVRQSQQSFRRKELYMSTEDFFKKVDKKIDSIDEAEAAEKKAAAELQVFMKKAIEDFSPTLQYYVDQIKGRGIRCESNSNGHSFSITLYFKDGGKHGLTFSQEYRSRIGTYSFNVYFTNDDGKNHTSTDGSQITQSNWSAEDAESRIQKVIEDFLFYADRHDGY